MTILKKWHMGFIGLGILSIGYGLFLTTRQYQPTRSPFYDYTVSLVNEYRRDSGLQPLTQVDELERSAYKKTIDMMKNDYFAHDRPDGTEFSAVIYQYNPNAERVGENLARCYEDEKATLEAWKKSEAHNKNMLDDWRYIGSYSDYNTKDECYYTVNHFSK